MVYRPLRGACREGMFPVGWVCVWAGLSGSIRSVDEVVQTLGSKLLSQSNMLFIVSFSTIILSDKFGVHEVPEGGYLSLVYKWNFHFQHSLAPKKYRGIEMESSQSTGQRPSITSYTSMPIHLASFCQARRSSWHGFRASDHSVANKTGVAGCPIRDRPTFHLS